MFISVRSTATTTEGLHGGEKIIIQTKVKNASLAGNNKTHARPSPPPANQIFKLTDI